MNKKLILAIVLIPIIGITAYVYRGVLFIKDTASEVSFLREEMLTKYIAFKRDTPESVMLNLKTSLESRNDIKSVTYISTEQGLQDYKDKHPEVLNDKVVMDAAVDTILPKLEVVLKSDNGGMNSKALREFVKSSAASSYTISY